MAMAHRVLASAEIPEAGERRPAAAAGDSGGANRGVGDSGGGRVEAEGAVYVYGLSLEGARWDEAAGALAESRPGETTCPLPMVELQPIDWQQQQQQQQQEMQDEERRLDVGASLPCPYSGPAAQGGSADANQAGVYECPLYMCASRSNFVMHLQLAIPHDSAASTWVLQGTAALCSLDDD
jgi:hypothetical protein